MKVSPHVCFRMLLGLFLAALLIAPTVPGTAAESKEQEVPAELQAVIDHHTEIIKQWVARPEIVAATREQNARNLSLERIKEIDRDWISGGQGYLATSLQYNQAGTFLKDKILANSRVYAEAFLCDRLGAVVGEYPRTSDYWQGDEEKFIGSYNNGAGKVVQGPLEYDRSSRTYTIQISVPVMAEAETIGVLVVGIRYLP